MRLRLRNSDPDDIDRRLQPFVDRCIARYANASGLVLRPLAEQHQAREQGAHFVIERLDTVEPVIVATAGVFDAGDGYLEMGNCIIDPDVSGFGLQRRLIDARVAAAVVNENAGARLITACKPDSASRSNAVRCGFRPWRAVPASFYDLCVSGPCGSRAQALACGRRCCCDFLHLPGDAAMTATRRYAGLPDLRSIERRRTGERVALVDRTALKTVLRDALDAVVGRGV